MAAIVNSTRRDETEKPMQLEKTAVRYAIDSKLSRFTVRAFASGVLSAFGHNPTIAVHDFAGEVQSMPDEVQGASLRLVAKAESLETVDDISDKDRREIQRQMHEEVLESSQYPEIVYECNSILGNKIRHGQYAVALNGELTLHGVTRGQTIMARGVLTDDTLRAFGDFSLLQTDYDIKLVSALGGALRVKDELKVSFDIVARKQA